ncbi:hypothetical protein M514_28124 [Trichuris suis]|uniref:Uncharacterized protein n=1 Tax=Trichuris suis TaxID=68888 RepID=A0A085MR50_9BILA|nr:hypothetical protein M514_28124 [Trichuris suis]
MQNVAFSRKECQFNHLTVPENMMESANVCYSILMKQTLAIAFTVACITLCSSRCENFHSPLFCNCESHVKALEKTGSGPSDSCAVARPGVQLVAARKDECFYCNCMARFFESLKNAPAQNDSQNKVYCFWTNIYGVTLTIMDII